mmetsp:Transcript_26892/g.70647  ORF Transcript_26892/g.70647 Transcript_26892/m.70647 type:complete len:810 (+) Transcript_26892:366-2795(+)
MDGGVPAAAIAEVIRVDGTEVRLRKGTSSGVRQLRAVAGPQGVPAHRVTKRQSELVDLDDSAEDEAPSSAAGEADDEGEGSNPDGSGYVEIIPNLEEIAEAAVTSYRKSIALDDGVAEDLRKQRKKEYKLRKVAEEMIFTEKAYCESLNKLVILQKGLMAGRVLSSHEAALLFGDLAALVDLHAHLYSDLVSIVPKLDGWSPDRAELESCVLKISEALRTADFLSVYAPYCANHPAQLSTLAGMKSTGPFQGMIETWRVNHGSLLPLDSHLLKPVQRILKYPLLVEELYRAATEDSELQASLSETCDLLEKIADEANKTKRQHELETMMSGNVMVVRGLTLSDKLKAGGFEGDVTRYGPLVDEAAGLTMTLSNRRTSRKPKQRSLFLFRNALLSCKSYDDRRITVKKVYTIRSFSAVGTKKALLVTEKGSAVKYTFKGLDGAGWAKVIAGLQKQGPLEHPGGWDAAGYDSVAEARGSSGTSVASSRQAAARSSSFTSAVEKLAQERSELMRRNEELIKEQERLLEAQAAAEEQQRAVVEAQQKAIAAKERELQLQAQKRVIAEEERRLLLERQERQRRESDDRRRATEERQLAAAAATGAVCAAARSGTEGVPVDVPAAVDGAYADEGIPLDGLTELRAVASPHALEEAQHEFDTMLAVRRRGIRALVWNETEVPEDIIDTVNLEAIYCLEFPLLSPACVFDRFAVRGYMVKRGNFRKAWTRRWFVLSLKTKHLSYYSTNSETTLRGSVPITNMCAVVRADALPGAEKDVPRGAHVMHIITLDRTYHVLARDRDTLEAWVYAIGLMLRE